MFLRAVAPRPPFFYSLPHGVSWLMLPAAPLPSNKKKSDNGGRIFFSDQVGRCVGKWAGQVGRSSGQKGWVTCPLKKVVGKNTCCKHISFTTARAMESIPGSFSLWLVGGQSSGQVCGQVGRASGQKGWVTCPLEKVVG